MKLLGTLLISTLLCEPRFARANCEHAHFHGPSAAAAAKTLPDGNILDRGLDVLTPASRSFKVHLESRFPSTGPGSSGLATWFLLDDLVPGQRYETRACYTATQPTDVRLDTFGLHAVHDSPELLASLVESITRHEETSSHPEVVRHVKAALGTNVSTPHNVSATTSTSALLLRIVATADYFTDVQCLMENVPPTYTEIILDPWVHGMIPATVVPIAAYVLAVIAVAYPLARAITRGIESLVDVTQSRDKKDK
jgi:hypothetical protein